MSERPGKEALTTLISGVIVERFRPSVALTASLRLGVVLTRILWLISPEIFLSSPFHAKVEILQPHGSGLRGSNHPPVVAPVVVHVRQIKILGRRSPDLGAVFSVFNFAVALNLGAFCRPAVTQLSVEEVIGKLAFVLPDDVELPAVVASALLVRLVHELFREFADFRANLVRQILLVIAAVFVDRTPLEAQMNVIVEPFGYVQMVVGLFA